MSAVGNTGVLPHELYTCKAMSDFLGQGGFYTGIVGRNAPMRELDMVEWCESKQRRMEPIDEHD